MNFMPRSGARDVDSFLLVVAAVSVLCKKMRSFPTPKLAAKVRWAPPAQVENAAGIGLEHNLALTCDPVGGLVQVPCIERNAMASVKAINAAQRALRDDGAHAISLDQVIRTVRDTGRDMLDNDRETSRGGFAVSLPEC